MKVKRKIIPPKKGKCCSVFFQQLKHLHICLPHFLLRSSDEYEKEMSVLSVISFYRQFGQLNHHLIIITKEEQKDKGTQVRFLLGPHVLSRQCAHGIRARHSWVWQIHEHSLCFSAGRWLCEIYNLCHTPSDNRVSHPKCTQPCQSRNWEKLTGRG